MTGYAVVIRNHIPGVFGTFRKELPGAADEDRICDFLLEFRGFFMSRKGVMYSCHIRGYLGNAWREHANDQRITIIRQTELNIQVVRPRS